MPKNFLPKIAAILVLFAFCSTLISPIVIQAQSDSELDDQLRQKQLQIRELEGKLETAQKEEKTLKSQLQLIPVQTKFL